jgi:hypothetical protein
VQPEAVRPELAPATWPADPGELPGLREVRLVTGPGDLWACMRAAELERQRQLRCQPDLQLDAELRQCSQDDPDSMEDEDQPYFWNRRD